MTSYSGRILRIDLSNRTTAVEEIDAGILDLFIGGKGLGAYYLYRNLPAKADPLGPGNILAFFGGPFSGTLVPAHRFVIVTKSPLTGTFLDTYAGGFFGPEIRLAGYDGIVITGVADRPTYLWVKDDAVEFRDATHLMGLDTYELYEPLKRETEQSARICCIGPAGENKVKFALIDCEPHRQAGRGGAGAVMGSKNLKAIVVKGTGEVRVARPDAFREVMDRLMVSKLSSSNHVLAGYMNYGTAAGVDSSNALGLFPTYNFRRQTFDKWEQISGDMQKKELWVKHRSCYACPIHCTKVGFIKRGRNFGQFTEIVEYETLALIGGSVGIGNMQELFQVAHLCDRLGLDTISAGGTVAFAMDCFENGILSKDDFGGLEPRFGDSQAAAQLVRMIAYKKGIGDLLSQGTALAAKAIGRGAEKLAVHVKGMEVPGWAPRGATGMGLAYATSDRGACHMRAYPIQYEVGGRHAKSTGKKMGRTDVEGKAEIVVWEQHFKAVTYSLVSCAMVVDLAFEPQDFVDLYNAVAGKDISVDEFLLAGERIWNMVRLFNVREGFRRRDDDLPSRFFEPLPDGPAKGHHFTPEIVNRLLDDYYALRGWDSEGIPTPETLKRLDLYYLVEIPPM